jgi:Flp pilus assembly protein TadG
MKACNKSNFLSNSQGIALAETAIVLPILLILMVSIAEFGRFFHTYNTLSKAVRAGSRYLSASSPASEYMDETKNMVVCGKTTSCTAAEAVVKGLSTSNVLITPIDGTPTTPSKINVAITGYTYSPLFNLAAVTHITGLSLAIPISPSVTMKYVVAPS